MYQCVCEKVPTAGSGVFVSVTIIVMERVATVNAISVATNGLPTTFANEPLAYDITGMHTPTVNVINV